MGNPIDGKGPIEGETYEMPIERKETNLQTTCK